MGCPLMRSQRSVLNIGTAMCGVMALHQFVIPFLNQQRSLDSATSQLLVNYKMCHHHQGLPQVVLIGFDEDRHKHVN